jgi:hypothetical protein
METAAMGTALCGCWENGRIKKTLRTV